LEHARSIFQKEAEKDKTSLREVQQKLKRKVDVEILEQSVKDKVSMQDFSRVEDLITQISRSASLGAMILKEALKMMLPKSDQSKLACQNRVL
jgi:hypothetical protein